MATLQGSDPVGQKVSVVQGASRGEFGKVFYLLSLRALAFSCIVEPCCLSLIPLNSYRPSGFTTGLGLEFVRQLLQRPGSVVATCRNPSAATELQDLKGFYQDRLHVVQLDTGNESSIEAAAAEVASRHAHVDLLLNVSGILHIPGVMTPETALSRLSMENLERVFRVNTFGPILVSKAFAPLLINAGKTATE